jgi:HK97 gp10 family phage protein
MNLFNVVWNWFGKGATQYVEDKADKFLIQVGKGAVSWARHYVPVDTGELQNSIGFTYQQRDSNGEKRLTLHADTHYAFFVEYGTRFMLPQPFLRPALLKAIPWNVRTTLEFGQIRQGGESIFGTRGGSVHAPKANAQVIHIGNRMNRVIDQKIASKFRGRTPPRLEFMGRSAASTPQVHAKYAGGRPGTTGTGGRPGTTGTGGRPRGMSGSSRSGSGTARTGGQPARRNRVGQINWHRFLRGGGGGGGGGGNYGPETGPDSNEESTDWRRH